jgi:O-phospho-L-seryl-tRNASec:L-selenocysteinyl-tRNA synthase
LFTGRASSSPVIDLFITLLSLGSKEYISLVKERKQLFQSLRDGLVKVAAQFGQRILDTPGNSISLGMYN